MYPSGLRLELTPQGADALQASALLAAAPEIVDLHSIYFDTPDLDLYNAGHSLRIRRMHSAWVQAVRSRGAAAVMYVRNVNGATPVLDGHTPVQEILGDKAHLLAPQFEVRAERRIWTVTDEEMVASLVLDRGEIAAAGGTTPVCDVSLELRQRTPHALFNLARRIDSIALVRLGTESRQDKGFRLRESPSPAFKAEAIHLNDGMTAAESFQAIALACVRQFRLNETVLLANRGRDALHQSRVALRRFRSALTIFRPLFGDAREGGPGRELRWLAAEIGEARNLDVLLQSVPDGELHKPLLAAREAEYDRVLRVLESERARTLMLSAMEWITGGPWLHDAEERDIRNTPARDFAIDALGRLHLKARKRGRKLRTISDEQRHQLRKTAKKLRYGAEFHASLFDSAKQRRRRKTFLVQLEQLQDQLGALNDIVTAPATLERLGVLDDPQAKALLTPEARAELIRDAATGFRRLMNAKVFWR